MKKVITSFVITFIKSIPKLIKGIYHLRNAILFSCDLGGKAYA